MTDLEQWLGPVSDGAARKSYAADSILNAQRGLFASLRRAFDVSGLQIDAVARKMGIDSDSLASILEGSVNLNLTELRHLSIAMDTLISYRVTPRLSTYFAVEAYDVSHLAEQIWDEGEATDIETDAAELARLG
ncbi:hypothetical protein ACL9RL_07045 [Plantibacter sp. Mn2098]|uniref:hypothetical protein n=1 Tax=Plantibacter sp. Mn2098 TaxID=3395266 RepID=UPI003BC0E38B